MASFKSGKKYDMTVKGDTPRYYESSTVFVPYIDGQSQNISSYKNERLSELYFQFEKTVSQNEKLVLLSELEKERRTNRQLKITNARLLILTKALKRKLAALTCKLTAPVKNARTRGNR